MKKVTIGKFAIRKNCKVIGRSTAADSGGTIVPTESLKVTFNADIQSLAGTNEVKNADQSIQSSTHYASTDSDLSSVVNGDYFLDDYGKSYLIQYCEHNKTIVADYWALYLKQVTA